MIITLNNPLEKFTTHQLALELITRQLNKGQKQQRELEIALENARKAQAGREVEFRRLCALVYSGNPPGDAELGRTVSIPQDTAPLPLMGNGKDGKNGNDASQGTKGTQGTKGAEDLTDRGTI